MAKSERGDARWTALTWDDVESWAGIGSTRKGRNYQRGGHVRNLCITADGALLATVTGTRPYATTVSRGGEKQHRFDSQCSCPIGGTCKHCVAVVADYLDAVANGRPVPTASENDPRWAKLNDQDESEYDEYGDEWDGGYESDYDRRPARRSPTPPNADADAEIRKTLGEMTHGELAEFAWALLRNSPDAYRDFRDRLSAQAGDVKKLLTEARKELRRATAEVGWRSGWTGEGHTPDYSRLRTLLERLLELGRADDVVALGRELIDKGTEQVGMSHDEGETAEEVRSCLPAVFRAVARSKMSSVERLLFAVDAVLKDDYDLIGDEAAAVLEGDATRADWSAVADALTARVAAPAPRGEDSFSRKYERERLAGWIGRALEKAGRAGELTALYEAEARENGSYDRLVSHLIAAGRTADAERWAAEGIAATVEQWPGIADGLAAKLCDLAKARKQWDVVAAHVAHDYFRRPSAHTFEQLVAAAKQAKAEPPVRAAAQRFLETGAKPYTATTTPARPTAVKPLKRAAAPPAEYRLTTSPDWPLPVPGYLLPLSVPRGYEAAERQQPHFDVLIDMAITAKQPERVLHWYDRSREGRAGRGGHPDRVAAAVADAFPERALAIYRAGLDSQLPNTGENAYQAAEYLKKMRPRFDALGRSGEWTQLIASLRETYARRRLFMEHLDRLDGRTIAQSAKKKPK